MNVSRTSRHNLTVSGLVTARHSPVIVSSNFGGSNCPSFHGDPFPRGSTRDTRKLSEENLSKEQGPTFASYRLVHISL